MALLLSSQGARLTVQAAAACECQRVMKSWLLLASLVPNMEEAVAGCIHAKCIYCRPVPHAYDAEHINSYVAQEGVASGLAL